MKPEYTTVFVIMEVSTGKLVKFGAKGGWVTSGAAKNAFNLHMKHIYPNLFDSQKEYIIEEVV